MTRFNYPQLKLGDDFLIFFCTALRSKLSSLYTPNILFLLCSFFSTQRFSQTFRVFSLLLLHRTHFPISNANSDFSDLSTLVCSAHKKEATFRVLNEITAPTHSSQTLNLTFTVKNSNPCMLPLLCL